MTFQKDEILEVANFNDNWWLVRNKNGVTGLAPSNHLILLPVLYGGRRFDGQIGVLFRRFSAASLPGYERVVDGEERERALAQAAEQLAID